MNPKLKKFLIICGYVVLCVAATAAFTLFQALFEEFMDMLYVFFLAKISSEILAFLGLMASLIAMCVACYSIFQK